MFVNYDKLDTWLPRFSNHLASNKKQLDYDEYGYYHFNDNLVDSAYEWLRKETFVCFHGTRLDKTMKNSIENHGLKLGNLDDRERDISRSLPSLVETNDFTVKLKKSLLKYFQPNKSGNTYYNGKIYFGISRNDFLNDFGASHFCTKGSEMDRCVVKNAFGEAAVNEMNANREPFLVWLTVPGNVLFQFEGTEGRKNTCVKFLSRWADQVTDSVWDYATDFLNWGMGIDQCVDSSRILKMESLADHVFTRN